MRKIKLDAYRAASFSGENHQKFFLGHMVVFRMHINKEVIQGPGGTRQETTPSSEEPARGGHHGGCAA
ncbi:Uncharacterized protein OBRU01_18391, partial [Operophtera brumata]